MPERGVFAIEIFKLWGRVLVDSDAANKSIAATEQKGAGLAGTLGSVVGTAAKVGLALAAAGATAVIAFGVTSLKAAVGFEKQMANVATLLDGDVKTKIGNLGETVKKLSVDTGTSTQLLTDGLYQVISAFGETEDSMKILETATKGAAAGNATVTDSVNLLSAVTKGYGDTSIEAANKASDLAFLTVKLGQTTFPELASSMGKVIPLAGAMKVSQEELFGAMATLTGVTGGTAEVSTQLRGVLQGLMKPSKEMSAALGEMGYASGGAALESLGLEGVLQGLKTSVKGNDIALAGMFGSVEAGTAVLALTGSQADNFTEKTNAMKDAAGATDAAFKTQQATVSAMMDRIKASINTFSISLGEQLLPLLQQFLDWVMDHMPQIQATAEKVFTGISSAITFVTKEVIPRLVAAFIWVKENLDIIGPAMAAMFLMVIVPAFVAWAVAAGTAAVATIAALAPVLIPIALVGLAVAGLALIWKKWGDRIVVTVANTFDAMAYKVQSVMSFIKVTVLNAVDVVLAGYEKLVGWIPGLGDVIRAARNEISNLIDEEKVKQSARTFERAANQATFAVKIQEIELKKLELATKDVTGATTKLTELKEEEKVAIEKSTQATEKSTEAQKKATEAQKKAREETVKHLDALGDAIKKALVKRYESEEKLQIDSLTKQANELKKQTAENIKQYDREYAAKLKLFDAETSAEMNVLQDQIDAINAVTDAEEKALKEQEYQARLAAKEKALAAATSSEEILKITAEMDEMIAAHERAQLLELRKQQIAAIKDEMDLVKSRAEEKREAMRIELEEKKEHEKLLNEEKQKGIAEEMDAVKNHYAALKTEEALQHTARKLATDKNNKEIITLLKTFNPEWQNAGQGFGNSLLDGLNSTKKSIEDAVRSTLSLVGSVASSSGSGPIPGMATGGKTLRGGRVIVGEAGPEILNLPAGATVTPLDKVGGGVHVHFHDSYIMDDYGTDRLMDRIFARMRDIGSVTA